MTIDFPELPHGPKAQRSQFDNLLPEVSFSWTRPDSTFMVGSQDAGGKAQQERTALVQGWITCLQQGPDMRSAHDRALALVRRTAPEAPEGLRHVYSALYIGVTAVTLDRMVNIRARLFERAMREGIVEPSYMEYEDRLRTTDFDPRLFLKQLEERRLSLIRSMGEESKKYPMVVKEAQRLVYDLGPVLSLAEVNNLIQWTSPAWRTPFQNKISQGARRCIDDFDELVRMVKADFKGKI